MLGDGVARSLGRVAGRTALDKRRVDWGLLRRRMEPTEDVFGIIRRYPDRARFVGPMPDRTIESAETQLGVRFPRSYRRFVERYGSLLFGSQEFYGLTNGPDDGVPSAIWCTSEERKHGLPLWMVVVMNPGIGDVIYCVDTSRVGADGEMPVIVWEPGLPLSRQSLRPLFPSFADFVLSRLALDLELDKDRE